MADFCKECAIKTWGQDTGDVAGLCKEDEMVSVLCEGCGGYIMVDHTGQRIEEQGIQRIDGSFVGE